MAQVLKSGTLLDNGKYRVERILGQGGFGITYLVTDIGLDRLRALKEFFPKDYCDREGATSHITLGTSSTNQLVTKLKAKFIKEARNIASLDQHPGIVKILTVFEENNTAYYVMDYIEGESLSTMVKEQGPLPVDRAIRYIREVGEALEYVHAHHINHLDIKPANIMIRRKDDKAILIDFGLAKQYDSEGNQTSTTPTGISHGYAPFEQYRDGGVTMFSPQTDVYSLAATLYYIISGEVPPQASELCEHELEFSPAFPPAVQAAIRKAMSTRRDDRHESVREFIDSLDSAEEAEYEDPTAFYPQEDYGQEDYSQEEYEQPTVMNEEPVYTDYGGYPAEEFPAPRRKKSKRIILWIILSLLILGGAGAAWWYYIEGSNYASRHRDRERTSDDEEYESTPNITDTLGEDYDYFGNGVPLSDENENYAEDSKTDYSYWDNAPAEDKAVWEEETPAEAAAAENYDYDDDFYGYSDSTVVFGNGWRG